MTSAKSFRNFFVYLFLIFLLCAQVISASAQDFQLVAGEDDTASDAWQSPDVNDLSLVWWQQFETASPDLFKQRADQFVEETAEKLRGLGAADFAEGQNLLAGLQAQIDLLVLASQEPSIKTAEPISSKDAYTLDELLSLRGQWRKVQGRQRVPQARIDELERQATLLEQRRDNLLRQYDSTDSNSPNRTLLGLQRVSARIEFEITLKHLKNREIELRALRAQSEALSQQLEYAETRLESGETDWHAIESQAIEAEMEAAAAADSKATLQQQLLEVLSADTAKPSLVLLRKQQLTRAAARQSIALLQANLHQARANWYRFHSGTLEFDFDIQASINESKILVQETSEQTEVWTAASQTTLITPLPAIGLNARKNTELAHTVAQDTLSIIDRIEGESDDLMLVQRILTTDMVDVQSGLKNLWTRLTIISAGVRNGLSNLLDFNLFHIGDAPVTPGAIITMLMILLFGIALSWFLRHLLVRLKNRRQFAKSPVVYTLSRVLHYIIIITAIFAALATIGLDFTNFALIAGALSVGIGFGLQSIVNNFVSGLILLFEGSLRVGDYVELDSGLRGVVKEINTRATVINTNDSVDVVVPNSEFVTARLTNWTLRESMARLRIDFGVAYGSDKDVVKSAALEAASEVEFMLLHDQGRQPQVRLVNYGDSSLDFQLLAWVNKSGVRRPERVRAQFLWALETKLREHGIEIPFPQRDLHLRTGFEEKLMPAEDSGAPA